MAYPKASLEELYAKLTIADEEEGGIVVGNDVVEQRKESYVLIGRFLTEKNVNFSVMQNVLASIWRPKEGIEIHDIGGMRYSFVFYHPMDMQKVIDDGPWAFEQGMLVYKQLLGGASAQDISLNEMDIWVQLYDIPKGFVTEKIFQSIGNYIGRHLKSDPLNLNGLWKQYYRIRVKIDVSKPLKRRMKIKRDGGEWSWINFKYERLGTFCFVCGTLGHAERECDVVYANPGVEVPRAYGSWLRATGRNSRTSAGSRWLRNGEGGSSWSDTGGNTAIPATGSEMQQNATKNKELVTENLEDVGTITITARNQEFKHKSGNFLNETTAESEIMGGGNLVVDPKRRRIDGGVLIENNGPEIMQTDGLVQVDQMETVMDPKNLKLAGSGHQTRQEP